MRLVCPNCDAEYEVDASAIPETGRDVQCSNCGHGWFQLSPQVEDELAAEAALFEPPPATAHPSGPASEAPAAPGPAPDDDDAQDMPASAALPPRTLDESLLAVLKEEADREASARRAEAPALETQDELGLGAAIAATVAAAAAGPANPEAEPDAVARRIARMKGLEPSPPAKPQSRRDMLPEIDEINTTLRASSEPRDGAAGAGAGGALAAPEGRSSFRSGFVLMVLLALAIVALYIMAPKLSEQIPAAKGALDRYVALIDSLRLWLDGLLRGATGAIEGKAP